MTTTIPAAWRPIESAPKDGTPVLLFARLAGLNIATNSPYSPTIHVGAYRTDLSLWTGSSYCDQREIEIEPTHWMPRPEFPDCAAPGVSTVEDAQAEQPYCYALETRGRHGDQQDVLLDVEYNGTDSFSGGRTGGIPLYRRPAPAAGDALDAARYRWLRVEANKVEQFGSFSPYVIQGQTANLLSGESLDACVDAAIAAQRKGGQ